MTASGCRCIPGPHRSRVLVVALACVLAYSGMLRAGEPVTLERLSQPLVGGNLVDAKDREAYGLLTANNSCSASLLRNNWAITAAHCVDSPGAKEGEFDTLPDDGVLLRADWGTVQERRSMRVITFRPLDIALIRVAQAFVVNGSGTSYNRGVYLGPLEKLPVRVFGRGIQQFAAPGMRAQRDGLYRSGAFTVGTVQAETYEIASTANQWLAGGDSGGPSFNRDGLLVGVHSVSSMTCVANQSCGAWTGPGAAPANYSRWDWVASTSNTRDAPIAPAWDEIDRYLGAFVDYSGGVRPSARVKGPGGAPAGPALPICDAAAAAKARNSPAAPGLEAKCQAWISANYKSPPADLEALAARGAILASKDPLAAELRMLQIGQRTRRAFDIGMGAAEGQTSDGPGKQKIHDYLDYDEQKGFKAAVSYSLASNRQKLADLAIRGAELLARDPLATLLRQQMPTDQALRGFDIGMAAADGQTEPGPGKQRIHDSLEPAEKDGFVAAVTFLLDRNRNAQAAASGAAIADADPEVAAARISNESVLAWLGFDIATGMLDDSGGLALSVQDPQVVQVRDKLSPGVRRGFDAGAAFHSTHGDAR